MNTTRRGVLAFSGLALMEIARHRVAGATDDDRCYKDEHCERGEVCRDNQCVSVEPCDHDDDCADECVCHEGACSTVVVVNNTITCQPVVNVTVSGGRRRRLKKRKKRGGRKKR